MSETKRTARPLSPHLQVYRPMLTMMMSILHRITGGALYFGVLLLIWWLVAAARSDQAFDLVQAFFGHWFGRIVLFGFSWALIHHFLGGLRHLPHSQSSLYRTLRHLLEGAGNTESGQHERRGAL